MTAGAVIAATVSRVGGGVLDHPIECWTRRPVLCRGLSINRWRVADGWQLRSTHRGRRHCNVLAYLTIHKSFVGLVGDRPALSLALSLLLLLLGFARSLLFPLPRFPLLANFLEL